MKLNEFLDKNTFIDTEYLVIEYKRGVSPEDLFVIKDRRIEEETCFYDRDGVCREVVERRKAE